MVKVRLAPSATVWRPDGRDAAVGARARVDRVGRAARAGVLEHHRDGVGFLHIGDGVFVVGRQRHLRAVDLDIVDFVAHIGGEGEGDAVALRDVDEHILQRVRLVDRDAAAALLGHDGRDAVRLFVGDDNLRVGADGGDEAVVRDPDRLAVDRHAVEHIAGVGLDRKAHARAGLGREFAVLDRIARGGDAAGRIVVLDRDLDLLDGLLKVRGDDGLAVTLCE